MKVNILLYTSHSNLIVLILYVFPFILAVAPCTMNNCSQSCANINGKETCFCMAGYQLGIDNVSCLGTYDNPFMMVMLL